jgi:hypothetical protein
VRTATHEKKKAQANDMSMAGRIHLLALEAFPMNGCWKIDSVRVRVARRFLRDSQRQLVKGHQFDVDLPPLHALREGAENVRISRQAWIKTYDQGEKVDRLSAVDLLGDKVGTQVALVPAICQDDIAEGHPSLLQIPTSIL